MRMKTEHLVDPELRAALQFFPELSFSVEGLPKLRADLDALQASARPTTVFDVSVSERRLPGPPGAPDIRVLIYRPVGPQNETDLLPAFLHIHGGGYVVGRPELNDDRNRMIARDFGCLVMAVSYRLAPETSAPGQVEDCYAALSWLHGHAAELGVNPARIAVGGESAGGGLAAALALLARDRGVVPIIFQLLIYPMLDDRTCVTADPHPFTGGYVWDMAANHFGWSSLLGCPPGSPGVSPYASPARAENLAGLPPAYLALGALDLFLEEDLDYARRLTRAGVPTELHVYPGAFHGFFVAAQAYVSKQFTRDYLAALKRALFP
jgi:acetyl esterase/lipase